MTGYKVFVQGYREIKNALAEFADNPNEVAKLRSESNGLYERRVYVPAGNWNLFSILERHTRESKRY